MKIIKLSFLKNQENLSKVCNIINLNVNCLQEKNAIELANLIRRKLLKDNVRLKLLNQIREIKKNERYSYKIKISFRNTICHLIKGVKITKSMLFINKDNKYYNINEFENIEEIEESRNKIEYNLSKIKFKTNNDKFLKKVIDVNLNKKENTGKDINTPVELTIINKDQLICKKKNSEIKQKLLIKIEMRNKESTKIKKLTVKIR